MNIRRPHRFLHLLSSFPPLPPNPLFVYVVPRLGGMLCVHLHACTSPHLFYNLLVLNQQASGLQDLLQCFKNTLER